MEKIIKTVLAWLEKNGFEAYIVGGYVRDYLLKKHSYDIDICTNALPKDLVVLFPKSNVGMYGTINFKIKKYNFEITTYRRETNYEKRHPKKIEYISNLIDDLPRRDFTINTLCMNQKGLIIDLLGAKNDIKNKQLKMLGDLDQKISEDPLRMFRAIRFASVLNFEIDSNLLIAIKKNNFKIKSLSFERIKEELDKILINSNFKKGLKLLKEVGILDLLEISYDNIKYVDDLAGMWAQLKFSNNLIFAKEFKNNIIGIKEILALGKIDNFVLYKYSLYMSRVAGEILNMDLVKINKLYKKLPLYSPKDLNVKIEEVIKYLNLAGKEIKNVINDLIDQVLKGKIKNNRKEIFKYLKKLKVKYSEN